MVLKELETVKEERRKAIAYARSFIKEKPKKPKPKPKRKISEDARARMDQRLWNRQIERENSLTDRQRSILFDVSSGLPLVVIAARHNTRRESIVRSLRHIRERLDALNNVHAVAIALRKGLIK